MKKLILLPFLGIMLVLVSCGPERDAHEICECYTEVIRSEGEAAAGKMRECDALLQKYDQRYKDSPEDYATFRRIYDACR